jgi:hypothetical protein
MMCKAAIQFRRCWVLFFSELAVRVNRYRPFEAFN